jgi:hypothetical protein
VKRISIDLSESLERVLVQALALPAAGDSALSNDARMKEAVRLLYDAAHGRTVDTPLGRIPIAPAVAPWLKAAPLAVRTRSEFLMLAGLSSDPNESADAPEAAES